MNNWAVKYRPRSFRAVKGQPEKALLWNILLTGEQTPPALLLTGPPGTGKTTLARITAAAINCTKFQDLGDTCGECPLCVSALKGTSSVVLEYDAASNSGAEDMRRVRELSLISSPVGHYVFIIDECHSLSHQAWNVLLKTIEEPSAPCTFIFVTSEPSKVPAKIRTRAIRFDLRKVPPKEMTALVDSVASQEGIESPDTDLIVDLSDGSPREAIKLLQQFSQSGTLKDLSTRHLAIRYTAAIVKGDRARALETMSQWWDCSGEFTTVLDELSWVLEKILFLQNNIAISTSISTQKKLAVLASHIDPNQLGIVLEIVSRLSFSVGRRGSKANLIFLTTECIRLLHGNTVLAPVVVEQKIEERSEDSPSESAVDILEGAKF